MKGHQRDPDRVDPIVKVITYITCEGHLLVFRQPDFPAQGVQVPGGSVEPGESLEDAALREAREETGLDELTVSARLGAAHYELKVDVGPPHQRHFFHLIYGGTRREPWRYLEPRPAAAPPAVTRELWWQPLADVSLDWEMHALLGTLKTRLGDSAGSRSAPRT